METNLSRLLSPIYYKCFMFYKHSSYSTVHVIDLYIHWLCVTSPCSLPCLV